VTDSSKDPSASFMPRALALIVLVVVLDMWGSHHLGIGFRNPGVLAGALAVIGYAVKLVGKLVPKSEREHSSQRLIDSIRSLFTTRVLVGLGVAVALLMTSVSSVTVLGDAADAHVRVSVYPVDAPDQVRQDSLRSAPGLIRFAVLPSVFGRPFRVEASGYVPATFDVYPVTGRKIRLGQDMAVAPTVLLRPSIKALRSLAGGGSLRVYRVDGAGKRLLADTTGLRPAAYYIGRPQPASESMVGDWERQLSGQADQAVIDQTVLAWKRPVALAVTSVAPGASLVAEIVSRAGKTVARAEVVVGEGRLADVPFMDVES